MTAPHTKLKIDLVRQVFNRLDARVNDVTKHGAQIEDDLSELHARVAVWALTMLDGRTSGEPWNEDLWREDADMVLEQFDPTNFTHEVWPNAARTRDPLLDLLNNFDQE
ncbi:hypothetical protein [Nocardia brasiliensis]|uniref:hypothetical protein n=1 Tax=Nocardia brasiliensis TaxID=37326 RepID=UPI0024553D33|nr:hypothetical protein [Nocardia brasiliensis]